MGVFDRTKAQLAAPEIARTGAILGALALIVAILALGVAIGKAHNAH